MKNLKIVALVIVVIALVLLARVGQGQEGCGEWLKIGGCLNVQELLRGIDRVWIERPCPTLRVTVPDTGIVISSSKSAIRCGYWQYDHRYYEGYGVSVDSFGVVKESTWVELGPQRK